MSSKGEAHFEAQTKIALFSLLVFGAVLAGAVVWLRMDLHAYKTGSDQVTTAAPQDTRLLAIGLVREQLSLRKWGDTHDCLQQHDKYGQSTFTSAAQQDGSVEVRHVTTVGTYIWRVFLAEKVIDPVQRPIESYC